MEALSICDGPTYLHLRVPLWALICINNSFFPRAPYAPGTVHPVQDQELTLFFPENLVIYTFTAVIKNLQVVKKIPLR